MKKALASRSRRIVMLCTVSHRTLTVSSGRQICTARRPARAQPTCSERGNSLTLRATNPEQPSSVETADLSSTAPPTSQPPSIREFRSLGSKVIESDQPFEEPPNSDPWEGQQFEALGTVLEKWFLPMLVVFGLVCGGFAAANYNTDADMLLKPAAGPDTSAELIPASQLKQ
ncbi:hypothetical protein QJQ45_019003 [Haematococcus lacustris]|nr:hypothetical protein QJQ45_019003 [Haematococcus lacustris]